MSAESPWIGAVTLETDAVTCDDWQLRDESRQQLRIATEQGVEKSFWQCARSRTSAIDMPEQERTDMVTWTRTMEQTAIPHRTEPTEANLRCIQVFKRINDLERATRYRMLDCMRRSVVRNGLILRVIPHEIEHTYSLRTRMLFLREAFQGCLLGHDVYPNHQATCMLVTTDDSTRAPLHPSQWPHAGAMLSYVLAPLSGRSLLDEDLAAQMRINAQRLTRTMETEKCEWERAGMDPRRGLWQKLLHKKPTEDIAALRLDREDHAQRMLADAVNAWVRTLLRAYDIEHLMAFLR